MLCNCVVAAISYVQAVRSLYNCWSRNAILCTVNTVSSSSSILCCSQRSVQRLYLTY